MQEATHTSTPHHRPWRQQPVSPPPLAALPSVSIDPGRHATRIQNASPPGESSPSVLHPSLPSRQYPTTQMDQMTHEQTHSTDCPEVGALAGSFGHPQRPLRLRGVRRSLRQPIPRYRSRPPLSPGVPGCPPLRGCTPGLRASRLRCPRPQVGADPQAVTTHIPDVPSTHITDITPLSLSGTQPQEDPWTHPRS